MTDTPLLFKATFLKTVWLLKRYRFNTVMMIVGMYLLFALVFFGGRALAPTVVANSIDALVVGFLVWTMAIRSYQTTSSDIRREAQWGTLEQLHLTPFGISRVVLCTSVVNVVVTLLVGALILASMIVTTGTGLTLDLATVGPLAAMTILPVVGIGMVFGGLALLYKRVGEAASLVQFAFVALLAVPIESYPLLEYLPLTLGTAMLREAMAEGTGLFEFSAADLASLAVVVVLYLGGGYLLFGVLKDRARKQGVLGHY